jgi:hypothetical protein
MHAKISMVNGNTKSSVKGNGDDRGSRAEMVCAYMKDAKTMTATIKKKNGTPSAERET